MPPTNLMIRNTQSPGDIVVLSAALRDLHIAHPGKYRTGVNVSPGAEHIFYNNPNVTSILRGRSKKTPGWRQFVAHYPLIKRSNQERKHFMWGFMMDMNKRLHTRIKMTKFQPDLHISEEEMRTPLVEPPYWIFLSGGKRDFRTKIWSQSHWQKVIDATKDKIKWVQCGGGSKNHIEHIPKRGIHLNMVAKTQLREFMRLIYHADGVACVVTAAMHIAAGFNKPCVVIAGGREPWWWEAYTEENRLLNMRQIDPRWLPPPDDTFMPHKFLHTMDKLKCCRGKGCWKSKLKGSGVCRNLVVVDGQKLPKCKAMIEPELVVESIFDYYKEGRIDHSRTTIGVKKSSICFVFYSDDGTFSPPPEFDDVTHKLIVDGSLGRVGALKAAKETDADWVVWVEREGVVGSLFAVECGLAANAVYGRVYRQQTGTLYPHPAFFATPTKLLGDGERFADFFSTLKDDQFRALGSMAEFPMTRPENV